MKKSIRIFRSDFSLVSRGAGIYDQKKERRILCSFRKSREESRRSLRHQRSGGEAVAPSGIFQAQEGIEKML